MKKVKQDVLNVNYLHTYVHTYVCAFVDTTIQCGYVCMSAMYLIEVYINGIINMTNLIMYD